MVIPTHDLDTQHSDGRIPESAAPLSAPLDGLPISQIEKRASGPEWFGLMVWILGVLFLATLAFWDMIASLSHH
jgi:hypothetical protein